MVNKLQSFFLCSFSGEISSKWGLVWRMFVTLNPTIQSFILTFLFVIFDAFVTFNPNWLLIQKGIDIWRRNFFFQRNSDVRSCNHLRIYFIVHTLQGWVYLEKYMDFRCRMKIGLKLNFYILLVKNWPESNLKLKT